MFVGSSVHSARSATIVPFAAFPVSPSESHASHPGSVTTMMMVVMAMVTVADRVQVPPQGWVAVSVSGLERSAANGGQVPPQGRIAVSVSYLTPSAANRVACSVMTMMMHESVVQNG